jgi:hypothetical protein
MKMTLCKVIASACVAGALGLGATPAGAQSGEVQEKPRLYSYVANWIIPRARWGDMEKDTAVSNKILDHAVTSGTVVAYGDDTNLVHTAEGPTHAEWWCALSTAGALNVLDEFAKSAPSPVLASATKHWDNLYVSRFYNWRAGSVKGAYIHGATYRLKADAPSSSVSSLSKSFLVPMFEKLIADGSVQAYQIAEESIHTDDPNTFFIFYITANAEGLDKTSAALREATSANALAIPALVSMVDFTPHRDFLGHANATFK